jgi:uncharacterized protein YkwD
LGEKDGMGRKILLAAALAALAGAALAPSAGAMDLERLIAPTTVCADQTDPEASAAVQEQAMRCMSDYARERMGMGRLGDAADLNRSAFDKSDDILRCDEFSHYACGRAFTYWMQRVGYIPAPCWRVGENIAWGTGDLGSVRAIFRAWIHSPEHRENILGPYSQIGIGLRVGGLEGRSDVHVWTQDFGSHCDGPSPRAAPRLARLRAARVAR